MPVKAFFQKISRVLEQHYTARAEMYIKRGIWL